MIRRVLTSACVLMGVLLLVVAWHLRDPEAPQSVIVASRVDNQVTLFQAGLGDADYWRRVAPPFDATHLVCGADAGDTFYFWTYNLQAVSQVGFQIVDLAFYQMQNDGSDLRRVETPARLGSTDAQDHHDVISPYWQVALSSSADGILRFGFGDDRPPITLPRELAESTTLSAGWSDENLYIVSGSYTRADLYTYHYDDGHLENLTAALANGFPSTNMGFMLVADDKVAFFLGGSLFNIETGQTIPITFDFRPAVPIGAWEWQWLSHSRLLIGHSPDGRVVAIRIEDGTVIWSLENVQGLYIGPKSEWLLYRVLDSSFRLMRPDGTQEQVVSPIPELHSILGWTDRYIIYKTHTPQPDEEKLWRMNPDGSQRTLLADGLLDVEFVAWSPNETWLIYTSESNTEYGNYLWAVRVQDSFVQQISPQSEKQVQFLAWGPPLPKSYTYFIAATFTGLLFLLMPFMMISVKKFMRRPELSRHDKIN